MFLISVFVAVLATFSKADMGMAWLIPMVGLLSDAIMSVGKSIDNLAKAYKETHDGGRTENL